MEKSAMTELLDMLQVQNPLRGHMIKRHKQEIIDAYKAGYNNVDIDNFLTSNEYYNETFNQ